MIGGLARLEASLLGMDEALCKGFLFEAVVEDLAYDFVDLGEDRNRADCATIGVFCVFLRQCHKSGPVDVGREAPFGKPRVEGHCELFGNEESVDWILQMFRAHCVDSFGFDANGFDGFFDFRFFNCYWG